MCFLTNWPLRNKNAKNSNKFKSRKNVTSIDLERGCSSKEVANVVVTPLPNVTVSGTDPTWYLSKQSLKKNFFQCYSLRDSKKKIM